MSHCRQPCHSHCDYIIIEVNFCFHYQSQEDDIDYVGFKRFLHSPRSLRLVTSRLQSYLWIGLLCWFHKVIWPLPEAKLANKSRRHAGRYRPATNFYTSTWARAALLHTRPAAWFKAEYNFSIIRYIWITLAWRVDWKYAAGDHDFICWTLRWLGEKNMQPSVGLTAAIALFTLQCRRVPSASANNTQRRSKARHIGFADTHKIWRRPGDRLHWFSFISLLSELRHIELASLGHAGLPARLSLSSFHRDSR